MTLSERHAIVPGPDRVSRIREKVDTAGIVTQVTEKELSLTSRARWCRMPDVLKDLGISYFISYKNDVQRSTEASRNAGLWDEIFTRMNLIKCTINR